MIWKEADISNLIDSYILYEWHGHLSWNSLSLWQCLSESLWEEVEEMTGLRACFTYSTYSGWSKIGVTFHYARAHVYCESVSRSIQPDWTGVITISFELSAPFHDATQRRSCPSSAAAFLWNDPFQVMLAARALAFQLHAWHFHYITIWRALWALFK